MTEGLFLYYNKPMLIYLIPTAKEMSQNHTRFPATFPKKSYPILDVLANLSVKDLSKAYRISEDASQKEWFRIQALYNHTAPTYPAYKLFNGLMYRYLKRDSLSPKEEDYLKNHVYITSALYGIIPASFPIAEHRLDFQTKIKIGQQSLKHFWREDYNQFIDANQTYVSLLSSEFEDVFSTDQRQMWISTQFLEEKNGLLRSHSTISKKARGAFLTACIAKQCQSISDLKTLDFIGFSFSPELSTNHKFVYIKKEA